MVPICDRKEKNMSKSLSYVIYICDDMKLIRTNFALKIFSNLDVIY